MNAESIDAVHACRYLSCTCICAQRIDGPVSRPNGVLPFANVETDRNSCPECLRWPPLAQDILLSYQPRASVVPAALDFTDDPFMWPFHKQPLYAGAMPTMFNATVLNGMSLTGDFDDLNRNLT